MSAPSVVPSVRALALDVAVTRGGLVESRHRVHAAVVDGDGLLVASARDASLATWWRSCAKPFQLLPFMREGGTDALGWDDEQLALACASHGGEPEHVALAARMLADTGLDESALACGAHVPLSDRGAALLAASGAAPTRLHNNCSGKHAAMLARAVRHGWSVADYHRADHPVQQGAWREVADWSGLPAAAIPRGVDGCGVTVFALPLTAMARAWAALGAAAARGEDAPRRVLDAMVAHPHLVGGTGRFDTALMEAGAGNLVAKVGAEGVHAVLVRDRALAIALKVEDGALRAQHVAVVATLQALGALPASLPPALAAYRVQPVLNTRGEQVGAVRPFADLDAADLDADGAAPAAVPPVHDVAARAAFP